MIATAVMPFAFLFAGPLVDRIFEPLLATNGPLAGSVGRLIGVGPGRGIGLLFVALGTATIVITAVAFVHPRVRLVEDELPDVIVATQPNDQPTTVAIASA